MKYFLLALFFCSSAIFASAQAPNIKWQKSLGGSTTDEAYSIQQTRDGGYIVVGSSQSVDGQVTGHHATSSNLDYWVVKLNDTGAIQWEKSFGGSADETGFSIQQTFDGGYIVAGAAESIDGDLSACNIFEFDFWLLKLDDTGGVQWKNCFGGLAGSAYNEAFSVKQTPDSNYIVTGYTNSGNGGEVTGYFGANDYWVIKVSAAGSFMWGKCLGGSGSDLGRCIQPTADGGFIVAGSSTSTDGQVTGNHGNSDYWVVKLNGTGVLQWQKSLGGSNDDEGKFIQQTYDGGYIVAGSSNSNDSQVTGNHGGYDMWVVKLNDTGAIQWQKSLGGFGDDWASAVQQTVDSGYIIAGYSDSSSGQVTGIHNGSNDFWVVKLSKAGNLQWQKTMGGAGTDEAYSIQQTTDSGYVVAGGSNSVNGDVSGNHGAFDYWVVKLTLCLLTSPVITHTGNILSTTIPYSTYKWELNGVPIAGATNATYHVTANGSYTVFVSDSNACTATSPVPAIEVGLKTIFNNPVINVMPNPTTGEISVSGILQPDIHIVNILGQQIKTAKAANNISIAEFPGGLYFVRLTDKDGQVVYDGKIIKR